MEIKISVVIPVYNSEKSIKRCINSVIDQNIKEIEIICVDDGSTDNSLSILLDYQKRDSRIKVLTQNNLYAGTARNNGMKIAKGEYLAFLDADDYFLENSLSTLYLKAKYYDLDIIKSRFYLRNVNNGSISESYFSRSASIPDKLLNKVFNFNEYPQESLGIADVAWNALHRRQFIVDNDIKFNNLMCVNDHSFFVHSIVKAKKVMVTDDYICVYNIGNNDSLIGKKAKNFDCQIANYKIVQHIAKMLSNYHYHIVMEQELKALLSWYKKISDLSISAKEINNIMKNFFSTFDEHDVRKEFIKDMQYKDILYSFIKRDLQNKQDEIPLVSIVVPVYNSKIYLDKCITSIINQTYKQIEVILIDDASTDDSLRILEKYGLKDNRVKVLQHKKNKHQGGARNTGIDYASGKYIWFVDSDDYIDLDSVEILVKKAEDMPDVDVFAFDARAYTEQNSIEDYCNKGSIFRKWSKNQVISIPKDIDKVPDEIDGSTVTLFSKTSFINKYRFRENVFFEDADFSFKLFTSQANFYFLDYSPYHRRITTSSTTGSDAAGDNINCIQGRVLAASEIAKYIKEKRIEYQYANKWFARWARWAVEMYLANDDAHTSELNEKIKELNRNYVLFDSNKLIQNRDIMLPQVVVSLTSYPDRIMSIHMVIESILCQTFKPDKIELYLSKSQFEDISIPDKLIELEKKFKEFEIVWVEGDIKPHKKYFYSIPKHPNSIIITFDDDVIYSIDTIERLVKSYCKFPSAVSCMRGHTIQMYDEYTFTPYAKWQQAKKILNRPSYLVLPTGVGGVLYPPNSIPEMAFNINEIKEKCLFVDDLWLKWMELKNCIPCVLLEEDIKLNYIDGSQKVALWNTNKYKNDYGFQKIILDDNGKNIKGEDIRTLLFLELSNKKIFQKKENKKMNARVLNSSVVASNSINLDKFIPKKIKGGIKCFQEHGLKYTILRCIDHLEFIIKTIR